VKNQKFNKKKSSCNLQYLKLIKNNDTYRNYIIYIINLINNFIIALYLNYEPCFHKGDEDCNKDCLCYNRGFCEKFCTCNKMTCKIRFQGCDCQGQCTTNQCNCKVQGRECDVDLCKSKKIK
jgi:hypothetical protein